MTAPVYQKPSNRAVSPHSLGNGFKDKVSFTETITDDYTISVSDVNEKRGNVYATLFASKGDAMTLHAENINLSNDLARKRYVKAVISNAPELSNKVVSEALLRIYGKLCLTDEDQQQVPDLTPEQLEKIKQIALPFAQAPDLIGRVSSLLQEMGLVGERKNALLLYLAITARLLREGGVSVFVKGPSASGKSNLVKTVLSLVPSTPAAGANRAVLDYSALSAKSLIYTDDDLRHRVIVLYEASGLAAGEGAYLMRSLISEGQLRYSTVEKDGRGRQRARFIEKEGPTSLITTTCAAGLDDELETRALTLLTSDTPEQSRAVMRATARFWSDTEAGAAWSDADPALAWQLWLSAAGARKVRLPFADVLAEMIPCQAMRVRRDFDKLMRLIAACALLYQAQRDVTDDGIITATLEDYRIVRDLVLESFTAAQHDGLTEKQREAIKAVQDLFDENDENGGSTYAEIGERLHIDKSSAKGRLGVPLREGYVVNEEFREGYPARLRPCEVTPTARQVLPTVEQVKARWVP